MIARPAVALGCRGCRQALYKAVLSASAPTAQTLRRLPVRSTAQTLGLRPLSSQRQFDTEGSKETTIEKESEEAQDDLEADELDEKPWFLDVDPPRHPLNQHAPDLPKVPENAPSLLGPMIKYVYEDMGLDDISMLDLRELESPAALGPNLIMLFATARSERHLHVSAGRFVRWLRRNYKVNARADGLIGPGELKTKLRRLRKKAKLMGTNASILPGGDNGISTGWVCVNFGTNDGDSGEAETFDIGGRFSGFGAPQTTTTIVVQCMTESRRDDLDLETLWQGILKRSIEQAKKIRGEQPASAAELRATVAAKVQLSTPTTPSGLQWQALKQASQQQRQFSTQARRFHSQTASLAKAKQSQSHSPTSEEQDVSALGIEEVQQKIKNLELEGLPLKNEDLSTLVSQIFQASSATDESAAATLALVDQLLLTAEERGVKLWSTEIFVNLIESIMRSPAYGPELERAQTNVEFLLMEKQSPLEVGQVVRLMTAYAHRADWERFWKAFRVPPRFQVARTPELYELAFRTMASTQDSKLCIDALRWVYPEMLKEEPPVLPTGQLYTSLKACILVADPAAEELLYQPPPADSLDLLGQRKLMRREFVRVLKEVEELKSHLVGTQAREERAQAMHKT